MAGLCGAGKSYVGEEQMSRNKVPKSRISRRDFLKASAVAAAGFALPTMVPSSVLGANAPSNRITVGCIGVGRMGLGNMEDFLRFEQVRIVAVCDVDSKRAEHAKELVEKHYAEQEGSGTYKGCEAYKDFREVIARGDIDVVSIVTPDHWHAIPAIAAAKAGKDIFLEKPLTLTIEEGRVLSDTVRRYGRVLQVGSQQRSEPNFCLACELVRNGRIGRAQTIKIGLPTDWGTEPQAPTAVPENLDYEMWVGPAPWAAYTENRVHPQEDYERPGWLRISDYGSGMITGWGAHHLDTAQWAMGMEESGPVEVKGWAEYPRDGLWDVHGDFKIEYKYENGVELICAARSRIKQGVLFEGTEGRILVRRWTVETQPESLLTSKVKPEEIHLYRNKDHKADFLDCIKSRAETVAPVEVGHRSCTVCLLGAIAMKLGRRLKWDPAAERFGNDVQANQMLSRPMRSPWHL